MTLAVEDASLIFIIDGVAESPGNTLTTTVSWPPADIFDTMLVHLVHLAR